MFLFAFLVAENEKNYSNKRTRFGCRVTGLEVENVLINIQKRRWLIIAFDKTIPIASSAF